MAPLLKSAPQVLHHLFRKIWAPLIPHIQMLNLFVKYADRKKKHFWKTKDEWTCGYFKRHILRVKILKSLPKQNLASRKKFVPWTKPY